MSSPGQSSGAGPGPHEERLPGHDGALEPGESPDSAGDTLDNPPESAGESDNQGGDTPDSELDTPGESSQTGDEAAGTGATWRTGADGQPYRTRHGLERHAVQPVPEGQVARNYDWPRIKARYVEGYPDGEQGITIWPTLNDVAAHFRLPANRIREKAAMEGWVEQRNRYQAQVEATRRQAKAAAMTKHATELDNRALSIAQSGLQLCHIRLAQLTRAAQAARADEVGDPTSGRSVVDAQEMQRLAQAVDLWHKIGLRAVGDPETHRLEISGPSGAPIEIAQELKRDDPNRLTGVLAVLRQAGLGDLFGAGGDAGGAALGDSEADGGEPPALPG